MSQTAHLSDTIVALATPVGVGAIAVIRLSGAESISLVDSVFVGKRLEKVPGHTIHFGKIKDENKEIIDECLVSIFRAPKSYTKEDVVEISCHGSPYIISRLLRLMIDKGARAAQPGEFTMRAFINGQLDLSQAEAVADLIASENEGAHKLAMNQLRGGFSDDLNNLRQELIDFAALIELELDFGEEDVEFADREKLSHLIIRIRDYFKILIESFAHGNAFKKGIPVAIVGRPNVGKSTLLNALLNEEKAIVSPIAGTTRDVIEDSINIEGAPFRFIDTAGIRSTEDHVESLGIARTIQQIEKATIVLFLDDIQEDHRDIVARFKEITINKEQSAIILLNKADQSSNMCNAYDIEEAVSTLTGRTPTIAFSAKLKTRLDDVRHHLVSIVKNQLSTDTTIITNLRHVEALQKADAALEKALEGMRGGLSGDFIAMDIRQSLYHIGEITGEVYADDLLESIFSRFCIGK